MNFAECPYDGTPINIEQFAGGFLVVSCEECDAAWEVHNSLIRRIKAPDCDKVRRVRLQLVPPSEVAEVVELTTGADVIDFSDYFDDPNDAA